MTRLTDTQLVVLSAAALRTDRLALPLPKSLKGGAAHKVIKPLIDKGLLEEVEANRKLADPVWRETGDGHGVTLVITEAGFAALGIEVEAQEPKAPKPEPKLASTERKTREGTKQALVIEMLRRPEGATLDELVVATEWQSHTVRGVMAGALKKKLGLTIESEKIETRGRVYKVKG
jgi:hypothetical protein